MGFFTSPVGESRKMTSLGSAMSAVLLSTLPSQQLGLSLHTVHTVDIAIYYNDCLKLHEIAMLNYLANVGK